MSESFEHTSFDKINDSFRPYSFALPDSETSPHPMAGTVVDQIVALRNAGEHERADQLEAETAERIRVTIQKWRDETLPYRVVETDSSEDQ